MGLELEVKVELEVGSELELESELDSETRSEFESVKLLRRLEKKLGLKLKPELELELEHFEAIPLAFERALFKQIPVNISSLHAHLLILSLYFIL